MCDVLGTTEQGDRVRYIYVVVSLLFAIIVTVGYGVIVKDVSIFSYLVFLAYVPYALTVVLRLIEHRRTKHLEGNR